MRQTYLRRESKRRAAQLRVYRKRRDAFLLEHPWCCRCGGTATQLHHAAGRVGADLLRVETYRSVCDDCHTYITTHPREAIERGWSLPRIGNRFPTHDGAA